MSCNVISHTCTLFFLSITAQLNVRVKQTIILHSTNEVTRSERLWATRLGVISTEPREALDELGHLLRSDVRVI